MSTAISAHEHHQDSNSKDVFGFWLYILSDCILFSAIFATFAVLHNNTYGGSALKEFINLPFVFVETMALLASSFVFGIAILKLYKRDLDNILFYLSLTFVLGLVFICMELYEFVEILHEGYSWQSSASFSAFFTLVGTHGLHVLIGLAWLLVLIIQLSMWGITKSINRRLSYFGLFWAFLDVVWIFVFTIVYLMEAV